MLQSLWQVKRDGNPRRMYGYASPFGGKLAPLNLGSLGEMAAMAARFLPHREGHSLVVGLTESSLLYSWALMAHLPTTADLVFTTREQRRHESPRTFKEPHSHGPTHFLEVQAGRGYSQVVIVEDEITTGRTMTNLILALQDVASRVHVLTHVDLRPDEQRWEQQHYFQAQGLDVTVTALTTSEHLPFRPYQPVVVPYAHGRLPLNPHGRALRTLAHSLDALAAVWSDPPPDLYMVGECVDVPLAFCQSRWAEQQPVVRHITLSPWQVDRAVIHSRTGFHNRTDGACYYLYNWSRPASGRVVIVSDSTTMDVAIQLQHFLKNERVEAATIEVLL